jgi:hypothetical protein
VLSVSGRKIEFLPINNVSITPNKLNLLLGVNLKQKNQSTAQHPYMAKLPAKKKAAKKSLKPTSKKNFEKSKNAPAKNTVKKKVITEKERELRAANLIANSEKKKGGFQEAEKKPQPPYKRLVCWKLSLKACRRRKPKTS